MSNASDPTRVRVRLVPKSSDGSAVTVALHELTPHLARRLSPDRGRAETAARHALALGFDATVSPGFAVEGQVRADQFEQHFSTALVKKEVANSSGLFSAGTEEFLAPSAALTVPEQLQDTIAFAYVPTPPRYFSPTFIPPNTSNYHLRIEDVSRAIGAEPCHRLGWTGRGIRIAMADSGFARHPFFDQYGFNVHRVHTPSTEHPAIDSSGHGTGESTNALVVAPDCTFFGIKHDDYSAEALETSLDQSPHILTNSWGWNIDSRSKSELKEDDPNLYNELLDVERILLSAIDDGVIVIFAGGNGHRAFPASIPQVIAVGGVTVLPDGGLKASSYASSFRSRLYPNRAVPDICGVVGESGNDPQEGHIMLPVPHGCDLEGKNISRASDRNKGWGVFSGTSAAAPQVAGVAALLLNVNRDLTQDQVKSVLSDSATDVTTGQSAMDEQADIGIDLATGPGLVNAHAACLRAQQLIAHQDASRNVDS